MEEHTPWGHDVEALEDLRVEQGKGDHLLELIDVALQAADAVEVDRGVDAEGIRVGQRLPVFELAEIRRRPRQARGRLGGVGLGWEQAGAG